MAGSWTETAAAGGNIVPLFHVAAEGERRGGILMLPALGVEAAFYERFAEGLGATGFEVAVMEMRGNGRSSRRPGRGEAFGYREYVTEDMAAASRWLRAKLAPGQKLIALGHSLGAHMAVAAAAIAPDLHDGIVTIAAGTPWHGAFKGKVAKQVKFLCRVMPLLHLVYGYFPGHKLGFAGREYRGIMADWKHLAARNEFRIKGEAEALEPRLAAWPGRVLAITLADDKLAPAPAAKGLVGKLSAAEVDHRILTADDTATRADHFKWARDVGNLPKIVAEWVG